MPCAHEVGAGTGHIGCAQHEARRIVGIQGRQLLLCGLDLQPAEAKSFLLCPSHANNSQRLPHTVPVISSTWTLSSEDSKGGERELDRSVLATLK